MNFSFDDFPEADMDLTPLIDTVFMLLIFFIMATTFSKPVLEVALQEAKGAAHKEEQTEPLTVTITRDGLILCGEEEVSSENIDAYFASRSKDEGVIFRVDKEAPFGLFVTAVDAAKKNGKERFAIQTEAHEK